jgi:phytanoyl-CoA hydroxylase
MSQGKSLEEMGPRESKDPNISIDPEELEGDIHDPGLYSYEKAATGVDSIDKITQEQIQFFHDQGYLVVNNLLSEDEIEGAKLGIKALIEGDDQDYKGVQIEGKLRGKDLTIEQKHSAVRKLASFVEHDSRLKHVSEHPQILSLLTTLMGEEPLMFQDMALLKPPQGREKPWHQDCAYFNMPLGSLVIGVWIALDEATSENGCLHIIPGSHKEGPMLHFKRRDWQICDTDVEVKRDVMVPLKPGSCLFWHGMTHHGSPTNLSSSSRRALQFHYKPQSSKSISKEERLGIFGGEMVGAEC